MADIETETFANQFRAMLDEAGYGEPNGGKVICLGNEGRVTGTPIGDTSQDVTSGVFIVWFGDSKTNLNAVHFSYLRTNGMFYASYDKSITNDFRGAPICISNALQSIGITPGIQVTKDIPVMSKDGEWGIFIN